MNIQTLLILLLAFVITGSACENGPETNEANAAEATKPAEGTDAVKPAEDTKTITVSAEGAKIDPPVEVSQIPAGAWYCDMGTVHFARMDKGDSKCPLCHMMLKQKAAH